MFLTIMASFLKLFNLLCSSKILIDKTLSNCNKIKELTRLALTAKRHKTNFLLSNVIFDCFKQILASSRIYFQQWRVFWNFTIDSVWFTSHACVKKKSFHAAVKLTSKRKKVHSALKFQVDVNFTSGTCKHSRHQIRDVGFSWKCSFPLHSTWLILSVLHVSFNLIVCHSSPYSNVSILLPFTLPICI